MSGSGTPLAERCFRYGAALSRVSAINPGRKYMKKKLAVSLVTRIALTRTSIHEIGGNRPDCRVDGEVFYYCARSDGAGATSAISGNADALYRQGVIVADGSNGTVWIGATTVKGRGPVPYIAENGVQV